MNEQCSVSTITVFSCWVMPYRHKTYKYLTDSHFKDTKLMRHRLKVMDCFVIHLSHFKSCITLWSSFPAHWCLSTGVQKHATHRWGQRPSRLAHPYMRHGQHVCLPQPWLWRPGWADEGTEAALLRPGAAQGEKEERQPASSPTK